MDTLDAQLFLQNLQKKFGSKLWTKAASAISRGEEIFSVKSNILFDGSKLQKSILPTYSETLGRYDIIHDVEWIFIRRIDDYCKKTDSDKDATLFNTICHEIGHAKEARLSEQGGLFRQRFNVFQCDYFITLNSQTYNLTRRYGHDFYKLFLTGIIDYGVDSMLRKNEVSSPLARVEVQNLRQGLGTIDFKQLTKEHWDRIMLDTLIFLTHRINLFKNGGLTADERDFLQTYHQNLLGDKWEIGVKSMEQIEFADPDKYASVIMLLFEQILGLTVFQKVESSKDLFSKYNKKPKGWTKDRYTVFCLAPKEVATATQKMEALFESFKNRFPVDFSTT